MFYKNFLLSPDTSNYAVKNSQPFLVGLWVVRSHNQDRTGQKLYSLQISTYFLIHELISIFSIEKYVKYRDIVQTLKIR